VLQVSTFKLEYYIFLHLMFKHEMRIIVDRFETRMEPRSGVFAKDGSQGPINVDAHTLWRVYAAAGTHVTLLYAF